MRGCKPSRYQKGKDDMGGLGIEGPPDLLRFPSGCGRLVSLEVMCS